MPNVTQEFCQHRKVAFGSGDYYLICQDCGAWWCMISKTNGKPAPEDSNKGIGATLSGSVRQCSGT